MNWHPSLRARLALLSALAVAIAIAAVSVTAYWSTAQSMRSQVDRTLASTPFDRLGTDAGNPRFPLAFDPEVLCHPGNGLSTVLPTSFGSFQVVRADGSSCTAVERTRLPVTAADAAAANGGRPTPPRDGTTVAGTHVRLITEPLGNGYAITVSRDLTEIDNTLRTLFWVLLLAGGLGALGALTAGWAVARAGLRPVEELTRTAEHVAATQDLDVPIVLKGHDEVARLAGAFNKMITALASSRARLQQLIADASHELRTPLTSLHTNIELLVRSENAGRPLPVADRRDLLASVTAQLHELITLTGELSLLAHDEAAPAPVSLALEEVVLRAVQRAARRGGHPISTDLQPWNVVGNPAALERALLNLLDNAMKFSPPDSPVEVRLRAGLIEVSDSGPGIPEAERSQVFQRFWRSPAARAMPGSGLGLAIVADVATSHGGQVDVGSSPSGGAVVAMRLPGAEPAAAISAGKPSSAG
jgi:two-component system, OmpR family, sensor histidine kinase MprB